MAKISSTSVDLGGDLKEQYLYSPTDIRIWYAVDEQSYTADSQNGTDFPNFNLPLPLRGLRYNPGMPYRFLVKQNDSDIGIIRLTGTLFQTFEPQSVCLGGVFRTEQVEIPYGMLAQNVPELLDVRVYDRRFTALRERAGIPQWRPENESMVAASAPSDGDAFWQQMTQPGRIHALEDEEKGIAHNELYTQMLCYIAAAMFVRRHLEWRNTDIALPHLIEHLPTRTRNANAEWVGNNLCLISQGQTEASLDQLRYIVAPCIVMAHSDRLKEHKTGTYGAISNLIAGGQMHDLHEWANKSWKYFLN